MLCFRLLYASVRSQMFMLCARARARVCVIHWHCSAQLSMFNMEKRYRNKIIIIIIIIIISSITYRTSHDNWYLSDRRYCLKVSCLNGYLNSDSAECYVVTQWESDRRTTTHQHVGSYLLLPSSFNPPPPPPPFHRPTPICSPCFCLQYCFTATSHNMLFSNLLYHDLNYVQTLVCSLCTVR